MGLALFATPVGVCGIAWNDLGIAGIQFPEVSKAASRARMHERFPGARESAPPPAVHHAIDPIVGMLEGDGNDLRRPGHAEVVDSPLPQLLDVDPVAHCVSPNSWCELGHNAGCG
jgi:hypothetical protein